LAVSNISTRFSTHGSMPGPGRIRRVEGMVTSPDDEFPDLRRWRSRPGWAVPTVELETAQGWQREAQEALTNARKHAPGGGGADGVWWVAGSRHSSDRYLPYLPKLI
jgi:hypothetical protein